MKPSCHAEKQFAYDFVEIRQLRRWIIEGETWWSEEKPWRTKTRLSAKWLQRRAAKARRQHAKEIIRDALAD